MQPKIYKDNRRQFGEFYELIKRMKDIELATMWVEITDREFMYLMEVVMPVRMDCILLITVFMTGEPICDNVEGTLHYAVAYVDGRNFRRPAVLELYNPAKYIAEIRAQYFPARFPGRES